MVPPPGTLLEPAEVQIGALVDARDDPGIWYRARVIDKTGRGARTSVTVRFQRFNHKHDRKFKKSHKAIRVRLSSAALRAEQDVTQWGGRNDGRRDDGFWEVERIIKVRKQGSRREFFVEWTGWEAEYNSWTKDVSKDLIDEYQAEQVALAKLRSRPPKYPTTPFTRDLVAALGGRARPAPPHARTARPLHADTEKRVRRFEGTDRVPGPFFFELPYAASLSDAW